MKKICSPPFFERNLLTLKRIALVFGGCIIAVGLWLLNSQAPAPADAAIGRPLLSFSMSVPADPPVGFSLEMNAHVEAGALLVEKLEFFYESGPVHVPTITKAEDGTAKIHVWVERPRVQLFGTKCEFVRMLRFSIPKSELTTVRRLVMVNHDTETVQVLAGSDELSRILREPEKPSQSNIPNGAPAKTGSGCGT